MYEIQTATRQQTLPKILIIAEPKVGKTYGALLLARGMVGPEGKILLIDTEAKTASMYADDPDIGGFDFIDLSPPASSERCQGALAAAAKSDHDVVIFDSASDEYQAFLDFAEDEAARGQNNRNKWIKPKGASDRFFTALRTFPKPLIVTAYQKEIADLENKSAKTKLKTHCSERLVKMVPIVIQLETGTRQAILNGIPKPYLECIEPGALLTKDHGARLLQNFQTGEAADTTEIELTVKLEAAAEAGSAELQPAYQKLWKSHGPAASKDDLKIITPMRGKMQAMLPNLKLKAAQADEEMGITDEI